MDVSFTSMKKILLYLLVIVLLYSCKKDHHHHQPTFPLAGTEWILYQYTLDGTSILFYRNDTLKFATDLNYTYNNIPDTYSLVRSPNSYSLVLHGTPFGDLSGAVPFKFIEYGEINGNRFSDIFSSKQYFLWLKKIK